MVPFHGVPPVPPPPVQLIRCTARRSRSGRRLRSAPFTILVSSSLLVAGAAPRILPCLIPSFQVPIPTTKSDSRAEISCSALPSRVLPHCPCCQRQLAPQSQCCTPAWIPSLSNPKAKLSVCDEAAAEVAAEVAAVADMAVAVAGMAVADMVTDMVMDMVIGMGMVADMVTDMVIGMDIMVVGTTVVGTLAMAATGTVAGTLMASAPVGVSHPLVGFGFAVTEQRSKKRVSYGRRSFSI